MTPAELQKIANEIVSKIIDFENRDEPGPYDITKTIKMAADLIAENLCTVRDSVTALERSKMEPERNSGLGAVQLCYGAPFQLPSDFNKIHDAYIEKGHQSNLYKAELKHFYDWLRSHIKTVPQVDCTGMTFEGVQMLAKSRSLFDEYAKAKNYKTVQPISDEELEKLATSLFLMDWENHEEHLDARNFKTGYRLAEARILGGTK